MILQLIFCGTTTLVHATQFAYAPDRSFTFADAGTHAVYRCVAGTYGVGTIGGVGIQTIGCAQLSVFADGFDGGAE